MKQLPNRQTVDLSAYPDLVVIYLGMRVDRLTGFKTLPRLGPQISRAVADKPDGLLMHENLLFSPRHFGMRQYWRDFESLERWARALPHLQWWQDFVRDPGGTSFWHETYFMRGGMEAIYDGGALPIGFAAFAPVQQARGPMFSARERLRLKGQETVAMPYAERTLYPD